MKTLHLHEPSALARHPPEDAWARSFRHPIFVVADGVTLEPDRHGHYPDPSGAARAAQIFCQTVVREAEARYAEFSATDVPRIFVAANAAVGELNQSAGRSKETSNFWEVDLFATTGAFVVINNHAVNWATIGDANVFQLNRTGIITFQSPEGFARRDANLPLEWHQISQREQKILNRKTYRNGLNAAGESIGYGVATGEATAVPYLKAGRLTMHRDDIIFLCTDGFAPYLTRAEFRRLLAAWPNDLPEQLKSISQTWATQDPERYGDERTLVALMME